MPTSCRASENNCQYKSRWQDRRSSRKRQSHRSRQGRPGSRRPRESSRGGPSVSRSRSKTERGYHTQIMQPGISMRYSGDLAASRLHGDADRRRYPCRRQCRAGGAYGRSRFPPSARVLVRRAQRILPGLKVQDTSEWMGHRPALPDTIPIVSPSSKMPGVFYATGHGHLGHGPYSATTARLIADMVAGVKTSVDIKPFRINRVQSIGHGRNLRHP